MRKNTNDKRRRRYWTRCVVLLLCLHAAAANTEFIPMLRAEDGDSLITRNGEKMRLLCIDAPEYKQNGDKQAKTALQQLVANGANVRRVTVDQYERALVIVSIGSDGDGGDDTRIVNVEMLRRGMARIYWRYAATCGIPLPLLRAAEAEAKKHQRGIWADKEALPPWEWKKLYKKQQ